ncbi:hypothetical protein [Stutzerimonas balearica]|uniref:hypothetical protein n=1 Tax=Stutzerimonas balearica TaxID=74829 RepID=UPI0028AD2176|nr:hypothetical protein [Stutzerimonas balearica]
MNERILKALDASYDSLKLLPPGFECSPALAELFLEAVLLLRGKLDTCELLALKDPRVCRLLPFWRRVFDHLQLQVDYVIAVRNPLSVARSLQRRNGFFERKSHWLWLQHYVSAVMATQDAKRLFVDYDALLAQPDAQLRRLAEAFGLQGDQTAEQEYIDTFLSSDLRHARYEARDLDVSPLAPDAVRRAYDLLMRNCEASGATELPAFGDAWAALVSELERMRPMLDFLHEYDLQCKALEAKATAAEQEQRCLDALLKSETDRLNTALIEADGENRRLEVQRATANNEVRDLSEKLLAQETQLAEMEEQLRKAAELNEQKALELHRCHEELHRVRAQLERVMNSYSLRITAPLRKGASVGRAVFDRGGRLLRYVTANPRSIPNALQHFRRHGVRAGLRRLREVASPTAVPVLPVRDGARFDLKTAGEAHILTTRHCLFVAELIARQLSRVGIRSRILFERPEQGFARVPHFVICPQMFAELPELYVSFQMEQTVSSRWLTDRYMALLEHSFAVFDYSQLNLGYFTSNGLSYRQMYFMPIGYLGDYPANRPASPSEKEYDVLFYGDATCDRRKAFIARIEEKYQVKVIGNLFGEALYEELRKAKVLINVHYYEGALLETTRIYESLSLDCLIVSESSVDIDEHENLQDIVDFVDIGNADAMLERLDYWLADDQRREEKVIQNRQQLDAQPDWFEFYFQRFLLATENIDFDTFYRLAGHNVRFEGDFLCLGLPESVERRKGFMADNRYGIQYFPGLRHELGWVGCGMSYKFIMRKAKEQRLPHITVCEDDVEFLEGWEDKYRTVKAHLVEHAGGWDVFSGFIADLHDNTRVLDMTEVGELEIVHIDHMVSAVLNVYNAGFYDAILRWDETDHDVHTNAIDRYMENQEHIRVFTVHPFLVGHKEEQHSTLWGFQNSRYNALIVESTRKLEERIDRYRAEREATP